MLKKIKIQNFECWKNLEIDLHPGINVFIGESDQGKSSIIRALRWNFRNRPQGFGYRSDYLEDKNELTLVETTTDSNDVVCRQRNLNGINEYRLNGTPLVALRTDVPDEIFEATKISDINIQTQHPSDQYFLLTEKPGYVAKEFNKVSGLSIMDDALSEINSQVRSTNSEIKIIQKEIDTKKELIQENKWIEKAIKFSSKLQQLYKEIIALSNQANEIFSPLVSLEKINKKIQKFKNITKALKTLKTQISTETKIQSLHKEKETLKITLKRLKQTTLQLNTTKTIQKALNALKSLENDVLEITENETLYIQLKSILKSYKQNQEKEKELTDYIEKIEKVFHNKLKTEECPVCGRIG